MTSDEILQCFKEINVHQTGGTKVYKQLLLLYVLGRSRGEADVRLIPFTELEEAAKPIFRDYGFTGRARVHYPFWYLQTTDKVWEVEWEGELGGWRVKSGKPKEPSVTALRDANAKGGLTETVFKALRADKRLLRRVSEYLLGFFPDTLHQEILSRVGLELASDQGKARDPNFRKNVLRAYRYKCAVCGFSARLRDMDVGVEAAHIRWKAHEGPCKVTNGLALCSLHHKLFDRGAFSLDQELCLKVSSAFVPLSEERTGELVQAAAIHLPRNQADYPLLEHIEWHSQNVYKENGGHPNG